MLNTKYRFFSYFLDLMQTLVLLLSLINILIINSISDNCQTIIYNTSNNLLIDTLSIQFLFNDKINFSWHPCFFKDKNYVYWADYWWNFIPLFSEFDYQTLSIITGIVDIPYKWKSVTTCQFWWCFKDKDAIFYPKWWWNTQNFFIIEFVKDETKSLPIESNYDHFRKI